MINKNYTAVLCIMMLLSLLAGCGSEKAAQAPETTISVETRAPETAAAVTEAMPETAVPETTVPETTVPETEEPESLPLQVFDFSQVPEYAGKPWVAVNGNMPFFRAQDFPAESFESYAPLDSRGRCGEATASIGPDLMPTEDRGSIGMVKPTGWHTVKYDNVDGRYLYNRCHLIGYQLTGENANVRNLITGTRYLNIEGMLPFENMTADYIKETGNHVLYRVTPIFEGNELLSRGVLMEAMSCEDQGDGICFCIFAYNVQPGIEIRYSDGLSAPAEGAAEEPVPETSVPQETEAAREETSPAADYVLNKNTKKFHVPSCSSVDQMKESNKEYYSGSREDLISRGYTPCKRCHP